MERLSIDEVIAHCNRQTRDYEILNGKTELENADISLNFIKQYWEHRQVAEWLKQLKVYKDAEEQGLLFQLPCKVGDTVYRLIPKTYRHIEPLNVRKFVICENGLCFVTEKTNFHYSCEEFGEFIFLTKEEAEQALKQMGE